MATVKALGRFFTPPEVVRNMLSLIDFSTIPEGACVLEPACYDAPFLAGLYQYYPEIWKKFSAIQALDIDPHIVLSSNLPPSEIDFINADFLLWNSKKRFHLILGNPPYGIPGDQSHYPIPVTAELKKRWKKAISTWQGKYNLYAAFIEKAVRLLATNGQLLFVIPGTFMFLEEFGLLRSLLAHSGTTHIYYVGKEAFKNQASVSVVFLHFMKRNSHQLTLWDWPNMQGTPTMLKQITSWNGSPITFNSELTTEVENQSIATIEDLFQVHISPRTPEIQQALKEGWITTEATSDTIGILTSKHLKHNHIAYDKPAHYFIKQQNIKRLRNFFDKPRIVVSLGFHQGRLAAAYDYKAYPWMGDVYHLLSKTQKSSLFSNANDWKALSPDYLSHYLSSQLIGNYIKDKYRDFIYHVNKWQILKLPLLSKQAFQQVIKKYTPNVTAEEMGEMA